MPYVPKADANNAVGFKIEQIFPGDEMFAEIGKILVGTESMRDSVAVWWNVIQAECDNGQRQIFASRLGRMIAGYMILKSRDAKISTIYVAPKFRGQGIGESLYGLGMVNLGAPQPYTVFLHELRGEFARIVKLNNLVLDDSGPLCVLNPGNDDEWANKKPAAAPVAAHRHGLARPASAPSRVRMVS